MLQFPDRGGSNEVDDDTRERITRLADTVTGTRWVLDTKVLLSTLLFPFGSSAWLRDAWRTGTIVPLASRETTTELIRVLCYPGFRLTPHERDDLLADYLPHCESVIVSTPPPVPGCRDPFDRPFLELARAANADALVTGGKDLHSLAPTFPIPILTPAAALATPPAR